MTKAYIFIGQSGSGKGTQAKLLEEKLSARYSDILYLETGTIFRSFIKTDSYTATKTKHMMEEGLLPPPFIGIHVWSHELINQYHKQDIVILDGTPRVSDEVPILLSAIKFYGWQATVVFIEVSDEWANERLVGRGRADDTDDKERMARLAWFHNNVMPGVELLKQSPDVTVVSVNGERSIEEIHQDLCEKLYV